MTGNGKQVMRAENNNELKITFYGDDFTGATDTLATAARAGLRTLLFLGLPTDDQLRLAGTLDCLGIAGAARAMSPSEMQRELAPVGRLFAALGAPVVHYKTCSTFDSAPGVGSIGAALGILRQYVGNPFLPIVGGQPNLRRYCVFGNLFAGVGGAGVVSRIDRHPTMSRHPVTPMAEADLARHLAEQGLDRIASLDYTAYAEPAATLDRHLGHLLTQRPDAVLMDVTHTRDLPIVGRLIWQSAQREPLLAAGASSVIQALATCWQGDRETSIALPPVATATGPVLILAGSLSPVTAVQLRNAASYQLLPIDAARLVTQSAYAAQLASELAALLHAGRSVLACTSGTPTQSGSHTAAPNAPNSPNSRALAIACGKLLADILRQAPLKRIGIAGGDTSSHAVQALDAWGLSYLTQLDAGVALCRLHSGNAALDGMEIMLKGGQMGSDDLFERLLHGTD